MFIHKALSTLALSSLAFTCMAEEQTNQQFYIGFKTGKFMIDVDGADDATTTGFQIGYDFGNQLSLELEALSGESDLDVLGSTVEVETETLALYATFRSEGQAYLLGKLGLLKEEVSGSAMGFSASESSTGLSLGAGAGFKLSEHFAAELEYTIIETDVNHLGLSARLLF